MINAQSAGPFTATQTPQSPPPVAPISMPPLPSSENNASVPPKQKPGISRSMKMALAGLLLLIVVVGSGVSYYLNQQQQDIRQQADEAKPTATPIVRPPETTAPTITNVCTKTALVDQGAGQTANLVSTTSYNSSQIVHFKIAVTKNISQIIPLSITDDFSAFTRAGYVFESAEVEGGKICTPDEGFNRDNPSFYKCTWSGAEQGETLNLHIRLRPTVSYVIEPEKVPATNNAKVELCELCGGGGGGALQDGDANRNAPTPVPGNENCAVTVQIPGNTGVIPSPAPEKLSCNSACIPPSSDNEISTARGIDPCRASLGASYACTMVIDRPENPNEPTHRCRLTLNPYEESCTVATTPTPIPSATPSVGCNQACNTNADCSNPDHVCSTQNGSKLCRLSINQSSSSCSSPTSTTTTSPSPTPTASTGSGNQPTLPSELPQTGPDMSTWLKAGLGALGLGIMFLLIL